MAKDEFANIQAAYTAHGELEPSNLILTSDPSHIWTQDDGQGRIGLRFDSGDSGVVYLDQERTQQAIDALIEQQKQMGWAR